MNGEERVLMWSAVVGSSVMCATGFFFWAQDGYAISEGFIVFELMYAPMLLLSCYMLYFDQSLGGAS